MYKLKKFLPVLLIAAMLVLSAAPAYAQARYGGFKSAAVQTSTALVLPAKTWVYGLEIFADAASSFMGIYNCATLATASDALVVDEIGEATQYDTQSRRYASPIYFATGVTVVITTGIGWVYYGPEPN